MMAKATFSLGSYYTGPFNVLSETASSVRYRFGGDIDGGVYSGGVMTTIEVTGTFTLTFTVTTYPTYVEVLTESITLKSSKRSSYELYLPWGGIETYAASSSGYTTTLNHTSTYARQSTARTTPYGFDTVDNGFAEGHGGELSIPAIPTYAVTYNANGGSGAPAAQTKVHGTDLTLSSTVPTRANHEMLGWSANPSATTATYQPGGTYSADEAVTLYAVWRQTYGPPIVEVASAYRSVSSGEPADDGAYVTLVLSGRTWAGHATAISVGIDGDPAGTAQVQAEAGVTYAYYSWGQTLTVGPVSADQAHDVTVSVSDGSGGTASAGAAIPTAYYTMDALKGGHGVTFGGVAKLHDLDNDGTPESGVHEVNMPTMTYGRLSYPTYVYSTLPANDQVPYLPCLVLCLADYGLYYYD